MREGGVVSRWTKGTEGTKRALTALGLILLLAAASCAQRRPHLPIAAGPSALPAAHPATLDPTGRVRFDDFLVTLPRCPGWRQLPVAETAGEAKNAASSYSSRGSGEFACTTPANHRINTLVGSYVVEGLAAYDRAVILKVIGTLLDAELRKRGGETVIDLQSELLTIGAFLCSRFGASREEAAYPLTAVSLTQRARGIMCIPPDRRRLVLVSYGELFLTGDHAHSSFESDSEALFQSLRTNIGASAVPEPGDWRSRRCAECPDLPSTIADNGGIRVRSEVKFRGSRRVGRGPTARRPPRSPPSPPLRAVTGAGAAG